MRLRQSGSSEDWARFVDTYSGLVCYWARKLGVADQDVDDFAQDVFSLLVRELPAFRYDSARRFRAWLWSVVRNRRRENLRKKSVPLDVPYGSGSRAFGAQYHSGRDS